MCGAITFPSSPQCGGSAGVVTCARIANENADSTWKAFKEYSMHVLMELGPKGRGTKSRAILLKPAVCPHSAGVIAARALRNEKLSPYSPWVCVGRAGVQWLPMIGAEVFWQKDLGQQGIILFLQDQSQGLHCLPFCQHLLESLLNGKTILFKF